MMEVQAAFQFSTWMPVVFGNCCSKDVMQRAPIQCVIKNDADENHNPELDGDSLKCEGTEFDRVAHHKLNVQFNQEQIGNDLPGPNASNNNNSILATSHDADLSQTECIQSTESHSICTSRSVCHRSSHRSSHKDSGGFSHEASFGESSRSINRSHVASDASGVKDGSFESALITAVKLANVDEVKQNIRDRPETINYPDRYRQTPIFWAVRHGNMEVLKLLLHARAGVQGVANKFGYTPLMRAMHYGQVDVSNQLLSYRSNIGALDKFRGTCLQVAATAGQIEAVRWLLSKAEATPLITHGDEEGRTPLHCAAKSGHSGVCQLLLEASAKPNSRDRHGRPPLLFSLARNDIDSTKKLISYQAEVNARDPTGCPLLISLVSYLLKHRERNETLCGIATLLEVQANANEKDGNSRTALMIAVDSNHPMLCAILCAHNATFRNLLGIARARGCFEIANILEEFGALRDTLNSNTNEQTSVHAFLHDLQHLSNLNMEIQVALEQKNTSLAAEKLQELQSKQVLVTSECTLAMQLQEFLEIRRKLIIEISLKDLRDMRLQERDDQFKDFITSLQKWHDMNEVDPKSLQVLVGLGVNRILACKPSQLELDDPYTKLIEDAQTKLIETTMQKLTDMCIVVFEEVSALNSFPDPDHRVEIQDLQCEKCMQFFLNIALLTDHARYCTSRIRLDMERDFKENLKRKADIAIYRLEDAAKSYQNRCKDLSTLLDDVQHAKKGCRKRGPEAIISLRACGALLEIVIQLLERRLAKCEKAAEDACNKWFPNNSRESNTMLGKSCAICLVEKATRIGVHCEPVDEHDVACGQCALVLDARLRRGEQVPCPVCKKDLQHLKAAPEMCS